MRRKPRIIEIGWTRGKPSRIADRPTDFLKCRVVIFFVFIFAEVGLLNCIKLQSSFRVELGTILVRLRESSPHFRLTRGSSWIWKSRKAVSQRRCSPTDFFSPAEDALKRRVT
jgi:hypothetical protein